MSTQPFDVDPWTFRKNSIPPKSQSKAEDKGQNLRPIAKGSQSLDLKHRMSRPEEIKRRLPSIVQTGANTKEKEGKLKQYGHMLSDDGKSKFLPNYKTTKLTFTNCKSSHSSGKKMVPYNLKSLRQYTEGIESEEVREVAQKLEQFRRIKTEEPEPTGQKVKSLLEKNRIKCKKAKEKMEKRNHPTIKIIDIAKGNQQQLKKGPLYNELTHLCDIRGQLNSKMSLMKRTYNLKKIHKKLTDQ